MGQLRGGAGTTAPPVIVELTSQTAVSVPLQQTARHHPLGADPGDPSGRLRPSGPAHVPTRRQTRIQILIECVCPALATGGHLPRPWPPAGSAPPLGSVVRSPSLLRGELFSWTTLAAHGPCKNIGSHHSAVPPPGTTSRQPTFVDAHRPGPTPCGWRQKVSHCRSLDPDTQEPRRSIPPASWIPSPTPLRKCCKA